MNRLLKSELRKLTRSRPLPACQLLRRAKLT
jgi:hypothetical protein